MTNYNERLDEILCKLTTGHTRKELLSLPEEDTGLDEFEVKEELEAVDNAKATLTSLTKELVAEAKPYRETIIDKWNKDRVDEVKATNAAMNAWADIYEQNLLKALESGGQAR